MTPHVAVLGAGPAGRGLAHRLLVAGFDVTVVEAHPTRPWRATYACWSDELPDWVAQTALAAQVDTVGVIGHTATELARGYSVFDTVALQRSLTLEDGHVVGGRVGEVDGGLVHLTDGTTVAADVVVDCRGTAARHAPRQTAFGIVVDEATARRHLDGGAALLMDWRTSGGDRALLPSFLYAIPLGDNEFLLEETCLAGRPALPLDVLERRLCDRLGGLPADVRRTERVSFPLLAASARPWRQHPFRYGAAGGFLHPTTGYSVAAALRGADEVVAAISAGTDPASALWPRAARAVYRLRLRGLGVLLKLDADQTLRFFDAFFAMPLSAQRGYLSDRGDLAATLEAMARVFAGLDMSMRTAVARGCLGVPQPDA
ncbi:lycopene cyclase [Gordonia sp. HNM0687]|uniref:Lycopene cyclase n=1 Tax=Gordonia mangrovi TaxID=2665643 RepID=A0A6L7GQN2_9ACTN|nr:lycopene cyclase family protein [Gordonia mangrovi]MXP22196.1 lycopene cyclase [Gordonia mangrovi]UVF77898.1 lycopene cyclase family protein [Gordonia mangrovi]